jgi:hypothetical protein
VRVDKSIYLILQEDRLPQIVLSLEEEQVNAYRDRRISLTQLLSYTQISYSVDEFMQKFKNVNRENPSAGKIDILLYPQIYLNNSWFDKLYGTVINIAPAVEVGLWKGASLTGQVIVPVWNNMKGEMDYFRAGMLVFRQAYRFPKNIFMTFNIGNFNENRMGTDIAFSYIPDNDRWEAGINAGLTGSSTFYSGKWEVSEWKRMNGAIHFQYNEPFFNIQFDITGQRYIYGDYGVRFDCTRHFREVSIGLYALYTDGMPNGGFHFAVPLPGVKRAKRHAVRVTVPEYFDWEYEAQSGNQYFQKRLGRFYETRPDQNRSQRNYNPSHLKTLLVGMASEREMK